MKKVTIKEIINKIFTKNVNIKNFEFKSFSSIENLKSNSVSFCEDITRLKKKKIKNCLIFSNIEKKIGKNVLFLKVKNPRYFFFRFHKIYLNLIKEKVKNFQIDETAIVGKNVKFLDKNKVFIGKNVVLKNCTIGKNCNIYDNSVIGNDGYGYFEYNKQKYKQAHFGRVVIGDNVDIGPLSNIERGHFNNTIIKKNSKIDALVQIGHNCSVGMNTNICAGSILSGNVKIGDNVWVGPKTSFKEKISVGRNTTIGIGSNVVTNVKKNSLIFGNPAK